MVAIGDVLFDRYELLSRLGRGGMAEVYRARDRRLEREVAVKVLADSMLADPRAVERFRREARSAASLSHPHIVNTYDAASAGDVHVIVMELLEGPTLADRIARDGRLPVGEALRIGADVADALAAAHARDLVHHDVKPRNVLFDGDGTPKVSDFGIARAASSAITTVHGSPPYVAPEQARGGSADPRSDVYALGCVLFEMLTGRPPFVADTPAEVVAQHLDAPRPHVSDHVGGVPSEVDALVRRLLAIDPAERSGSVREVRDELRRLAGTRLATPTVDGDATEVVERGSTMLLPADATSAVAADAGRTPDDATIYGQASPVVYEPVEYDEVYGDGPGSGYGPSETGTTDHRRLRRRSGLRPALVAVALVVLAIIALAAWADGRLGGAEATDQPADTAPAEPDPADAEQDAPGADPAPADDPVVGEGLGRLLDRLRNADDAGADTVDRLRDDLADAIRQRAEDATDAQIERLRERLDELVDSDEIDSGLADRLRGLIDDATGD